MYVPDSFRMLLSKKIGIVGRDSSTLEIQKRNFFSGAYTIPFHLKDEYKKI